MKTQEEYAREIDEIVRRDVESCQIDWFKWYLYWYDHDDNPAMIKIERREILLLN